MESAVVVGILLRFLVRYESAPILNLTQFNFSGKHFYFHISSNAPNWTQFHFSGNCLPIPEYVFSVFGTQAAPRISDLVRLALGKDS
jgi:hypothetical protein